MLNKLREFIRRYALIEPGDKVVCALSGGADSVAMTYGLWLLRQQLGITLEAAHFNHCLRGQESDRDEAFVRRFCHDLDIVLHVGSMQVQADEKGLENAARVARYAFLESLDGKIATAHTCDDNAETVLLHLVRGTGLRGLGGIAPQRGRIIRPMLGVSRRDVEDFCGEYSLDYIYDSSNSSDAFLRNRLRHQVMPLLYRENPSLGENWSEMALALRRDQEALEECGRTDNSVQSLRSMAPALRVRALEKLLKDFGVKEPQRRHLELAQSLVFSTDPSAWAVFPGNIRVGRCYDRLERLEEAASWEPVQIPGPGKYSIEEIGLTVFAEQAGQEEKAADCFTVRGGFPLMLRPRQTGDRLRLSGGSKSVKKLLIDRKIPAKDRHRLPVVEKTDILGVLGLGRAEGVAEEGPVIRLRAVWTPQIESKKER